MIGQLPKEKKKKKRTILFVFFNICLLMSPWLTNLLSFYKWNSFIILWMKKKAKMGTNVNILCASFLMFTFILHSCLHYEVAAGDLVAETRRRETEIFIDRWRGSWRWLWTSTCSISTRALLRQLHHCHSHVQTKTTTTWPLSPNGHLVPF